MKAFYGFLIAILFSTSFAQAHDHPSVHGMLIVGTKKIYVSHLPMFHSPHDYQVILEVELSPKAQAAYLENLENSSESVYTLVPETFVLPDMVKNPKDFSALVYKGHFERGGTLIAENVTVKIKKVIYFKKFDPTAMKPQHGSYILFGNTQEQFLAHLITAKPDFDQVLKVKPVSEMTETLSQDGAAVIEFTSLPNAEPLKPGPQTAKARDTKLLNVDVGASLYFETGDLAH